MAEGPYTGSLDPFRDMTDHLHKMGVAYVLMIGMEGHRNTMIWSNVRGWGLDGIESAAHAINTHLKGLLKKEEG